MDDVSKHSVCRRSVVCYKVRDISIILESTPEFARINRIELEQTLIKGSNASCYLSPITLPCFCSQLADMRKHIHKCNIKLVYKFACG